MEWLQKADTRVPHTDSLGNSCLRFTLWPDRIAADPGSPKPEKASSSSDLMKLVGCPETKCTLMRRHMGLYDGTCLQDRKA